MVDNDFTETCAITGKKFHSKLNAAKVSSEELDKIFLNENMVWCES